MTANDHTTYPAKSTLPIFLGLTLAGIAGNWFGLPLFLDAHFVFGSIFALLALKFLGPGRGLLAGLLISSVTYKLWNHPYAIIILTLEVAVVGWLQSRRGMCLVTADTIYWCLLGIPLTFLFTLLIMHVPQSSVGFIAIKQALNGIGNALVAWIVFTAWRLAGHHGRISLRESVFNLLVFFVLIPSLLLQTITTQDEFHDADQNARSHLLQTSAVATTRLNAWLINRQHPIAYLSKLAETLPPAEMQEHLEQIRATDPNFLRLGLMDKDATAIAYAPPVDDQGQKTIGLNFADRPYFTEIRQSLKPRLSDIMMGRIGASPGPIVAALHPVIKNDRFYGYVGAVLDLKGLQDYLKLSIDYPGMNYALLDNRNHVILSNDPAQKVMTPFAAGQDLVVLQDGGLRQSIPTLPANVPIMERWKKSLYVVESDLKELSGWRIVINQSMEPIRLRLNSQFANRLNTLFALLLLAMALANLLSRKASAALESLLTASSGLPDKIGSGEPLIWPQSTLHETERIVANFKEMANTLKKKFSEVTEINATLEQRVLERTQKLQESETRYRELFEAESDAIVLVDNESGRILEANNAASELYQYGHDEILKKRNTDFSAEPEKTKQATSAIDLASNSALVVKIPLRLHRKKDGTVFPVEITGRFFMLHGRSVHIAAIRDITERKQAETALKESEARFRNLLEHVPAVAVQGYRMDGTTFYWNDASETLYGYTAQEAIGLNLLDLIIPPAMRSDVRQAIQQMANNCQPIPSAELTLMRKDGSLVDVFSSHAIVTAQGREPELFCLDVDMTQIKEGQDALRRALREKEVLVKEVHHRVKNNMQVIYSLLNLQAMGITDQSIRTMFEESRNRVNSMALIHEQLYQAKDLANINFKSYLQSLVKSIAQSYNRPEISMTVEMTEDISLNVNLAIPCGLIVNELVSNSLKHAFPTGLAGEIRVGLKQGPEGDYLLTVTDNGSGLPTGLDFKKTTSLGLQLVNVLAGQLHGTLSISQNGGSQFRISFPPGNKNRGPANG